MDVTEWLLDSDPAIRWQVMRDLTDEPADVVAAERARVATEGWGARLLALQGDDGQWGGGTYSPKWISTTYTLLLLRLLGLDPASEEARAAVQRVRDGVRWQRRSSGPFFAGETETCVNSMVVALGAYFGEHGAEQQRLREWLLGEQLDDGGWNCEAPARSRRSSFNTTILALEGLLEVEQSSRRRSRDRGRPRSRRGVPPRATAVPVADHRRGGQPDLAAVLVPTAVALRRAARARVLPCHRRAARPAVRRGHRPRA